MCADSEDEIELRFSGEGGMAYQIAGRYFVPWQHNETSEPLANMVDSFTPGPLCVETWGIRVNRETQSAERASQIFPGS